MKWGEKASYITEAQGSSQNLQQHKKSQEKVTGIFVPSGEHKRQHQWSLKLFFFSREKTLNIPSLCSDAALSWQCLYIEFHLTHSEAEHWQGLIYVSNKCQLFWLSSYSVLYFCNRPNQNLFQKSAKTTAIKLVLAGYWLLLIITEVVCVLGTIPQSF